MSQRRKTKNSAQSASAKLMPNQNIGVTATSLITNDSDGVQPCGRAL